MFDDASFDDFLSEGYITEVIRPIKSGKEASVYLCRANRSTTGRSLLAVKAYRSREHRTFRNDAVYKSGRFAKSGHSKAHREIRAMQTKTRFGRTLDEGWWMNHEYETLRTLAEAGADVPAVLATSGNGILMEYLGDEETPAPQLRHVDLDPGEAREVFDRLLWNVELALGRNVIHSDLSSFNVLYWQGAVTLIDFPQAVDPRTNQNAYPLLQRDLENLCKHFERLGVRRDAGALAADFWTRFIFAEL